MRCLEALKHSTFDAPHLRTARTYSESQSRCAFMVTPIAASGTEASVQITSLAAYRMNPKAVRAIFSQLDARAEIRNDFRGVYRDPVGHTSVCL